MSDLGRIIAEYVRNELRRAKKDIIKAANITVNELYEESWRMYDSFIDQFYSYQTKSYIRHGESQPGTGMGSNLYRAQRITKKNGNNPKLNIQIDASDMAGGYQHGTSAQTVLENVMNGIRGIPGYWNIPWHGSYDGKYYSCSGTLQNAFNNFENNFDDIAGYVLDEEVRRLGW